MSVEVFKTKRNDDGKPYRFFLKDSDGGVDLTGASFKTTMTNVEDGTTKAIDESALGITLSNQTTNPGEGYRDWQANETDTAGEYEIEFEVTFAAGEIITWPDEDAEKCIVIIEPDLNAA